MRGSFRNHDARFLHAFLLCVRASLPMPYFCVWLPTYEHTHYANAHPRTPLFHPFAPPTSTVYGPNSCPGIRPFDYLLRLALALLHFSPFFPRRPVSLTCIPVQHFGASHPAFRHAFSLFRQHCPRGCPPTSCPSRGLVLQKHEEHADAGNGLCSSCSGPQKGRFTTASPLQCCSMMAVIAPVPGGPYSRNPSFCG